MNLSAVSELQLFNDLGFDTKVLSQEVLNDFISLGKPVWQLLRERISDLLNIKTKSLQNHSQKVLVNMEEASMHLPVRIGDYTDFYSSIEHATNVGTMFRGKDNALMPNWKHIPIGYHGRASSIIISGTDIHRPKGQTMPQGSDVPIFGASKRMDIELEMAFITGKATQVGDSIPVDTAEEAIFGMVLFNDWSARDIQKWEYVPLGPFLGKNFASSMSPWIVTMDALEPFRVTGPIQNPPPLPYLQTSGKKNIDIELEVYLQPESKKMSLISRSNFKYMYWNMAQQVAHHTVNGCNINVGDMYASGTISGPNKSSYGSMLELSWGGKEKIILDDGTERTFLQDNDTVTIKGTCNNGEIRLGFGEVKGKLLPSK